MLTRLGCTAILIALVGCSQTGADAARPAATIDPSRPGVSIMGLSNSHYRLYDPEYDVVCYTIQYRGTSAGSAISCVQVQP